MSENFKNEIISENKFQRKNALQKLITELKNENNDQEKCQKIFNDYQVYILKCFRDESEMVRELSIDLMLNLISRLNLNDYYLTYIFPVIVERIGSPEINEPSEEIRLTMIEFMKEIINIYAKTDFLAPFLNDIIEVLVQCLTDNYPKVKISSCECIIITAKSLKNFHMQCENLLKPLLKCFTHQHFKVRVIAIESCGVIIMNGSYKALENCNTYLAEKLFDPIPQVRQSVIKVSAKLLTEYRDRYSFFHKILPLLLTGLADEIPETRNIAETLWAQVGIQYQNENEKDLKEELDYIENIPKVTKYPRPNLGCRTLVQRNVSKIIPALCRELSTTWQDDIKIRCGQLLTSLILHCEENFTQNLQEVFTSMFSVCRKNDDCSSSVINAAKLIGVYIPQQTWFTFVSEILNSNVNCGHLRVIRAILSGCDDITSIRNELSSLLATRNVCHNRDMIYQKELIEICVLVSKFESNPEFDLAVVVSAVLGLRGENDGFLDAEKLLERFWINSDKAVDVCEAILNSLTTPPNCWTAVTTDRCIFDYVLGFSKNIENLQTILVLDILNQIFCENEDPEAKILTFINLSNCIQTWNKNKCEKNSEFYEKIAYNIILQSLIWKAGRSREAIRTISVQCLCFILESGPYIWTQNGAFVVKLAPLLISLLEDTQKHTRAYSIKCLCYLNLPDQELLIKVYQLLLSRLDDEFDTARLAAVEALKHLFENLPKDFDINIFNSHFEHAIETILVHLEDNDAELQKELMDTLIVISKIKPSYVINKISNKKHLFEENIQYDDFIDAITS